MDVKIDSAEHKSMDDLFMKHCGNVERVALPFGDYWIYDGETLKLVITFKMVNDYIKSYRNGHLMDEIADLYEQSPVPFALVIVDDGYIYNNMRPFFERTLNGMNFRIPTFRFKSRKAAVEFMLKMGASDTIGKVVRKVNVERAMNNTITVYQSLPGIGKKNAEKIYNRYTTLGELVRATQNNGWSDGILGPKTTKVVERFINAGIEPKRLKRGGGNT